jgi:uncharacterized membrane protein YvlD (DUF360 family)
MNITGLVIGALLGALVSGLVIWLVGRLGWGIEVDGFGPAYLAALVIGVLSAAIQWLWLTVFKYTPPLGLAGAISNLFIAAGLFVLAGRWIKGLRVKGFGGGLIAAAAVTLVAWLIWLGVSALVA